MTVLLILILPLVFVLYAVFSKDASGTFTAYIIGLLAGLIALIINSFFPLAGMVNSASFWVQVFRFFLDYFLLNSIFALAAFFLISFSISGEVLDTAASALFGSFSVIFANIAFQSINTPVITELVFLLLIITGSILILDCVFNILISTLTISFDFPVFLIAFVVLLLCFFLGSVALASFYLTSSSITALAISGGLCVVGIISNVILTRLS